MRRETISLKGWRVSQNALSNLKNLKDVIAGAMSYHGLFSPAIQFKVHTAPCVLSHERVCASACVKCVSAAGPPLPRPLRRPVGPRTGPTADQREGAIAARHATREDWEGDVGSVCVCVCVGGGGVLPVGCCRGGVSGGATAAG